VGHYGIEPGRASGNNKKGVAPEGRAFRIRHETADLPQLDIHQNRDRTILDLN
jgi:hypothetical protein